jgi:hypothetical protein
MTEVTLGARDASFKFSRSALEVEAVAHMDRWNHFYFGKRPGLLVVANGT